MFAALRHDELAIHVGERPGSRSPYRLSDPTAVRAFLWWLIETRTRGPAGPVPSLERRPTAAPSRARFLVISNRTPSTGPRDIPERLLAFECLLDTRPEWRGQICFVQISVPSREDVPEYAELRHRVEMLVGRINGRFGEANWVPVRYLYRSYDHAVLAQLYRAAEVALVTPLRDGLNLVAKEYVVAQDPEHPGVLVLSKFAGAAAELGDAVITNPYHAEGLADDIDLALRMSSTERRERHGKLLDALAGKPPQGWATAFLDRLLSTARSVA
jgi:trehalose-6-phosphate synthase